MLPRLKCLSPKHRMKLLALVYHFRGLLLPQDLWLATLNTDAFGSPEYCTISLVLHHRVIPYTMANSDQLKHREGHLVSFTYGFKGWVERARTLLTLGFHPSTCQLPIQIHTTQLSTHRVVVSGYLHRGSYCC